MREILGLIFTVLGIAVIAFTLTVFFLNLIKGANPERRSNSSDNRLRRQIHNRKTTQR